MCITYYSMYFESNTTIARVLEYNVSNTQAYVEIYVRKPILKINFIFAHKITINTIYESELIFSILFNSFWEKDCLDSMLLINWNKTPVKPQAPSMLIRIPNMASIDGFYSGIGSYVNKKKQMIHMLQSKWENYKHKYKNKNYFYHSDMEETYSRSLINKSLNSMILAIRRFFRENNSLISTIFYFINFKIFLE